MKRFAKTIVKVLVAYVNIVKEEFPQVVQDERIVSLDGNVFLREDDFFRNTFTLRLGLHIDE